MTRWESLGFVFVLNVVLVCLQRDAGTDMEAMLFGWCLGILDGLAVTLIK